MNLLFIIKRYISGQGSSLLSINARLSFLGVFLGTSLLVIVLSVFNGFQSQLTKSISQFDPHLTLNISSSQGDEKIQDWKNWASRIELKLAGKATSVEGMIQSAAILRKNSIIEHVFLRAQEFPEYKEPQSWIRPHVSPDPTSDLRSQKKDDFSIPAHFPEITEPANFKSFRKEDIAFIGQEMALAYNLRIGDTIDLIAPRGQYNLKVGVTPSMKTYKIAAFFKTGHYQYDSKVVILPLYAGQALFETGDSVGQIIIRLHDLKNLNEARREIFKIWPFHIKTLEEEQRNFFAALRLEKTIMTIIVFLFIIAAMVGIIVALYNVVRSKRKDIGILKALGLSDRSVLLIFLSNGFIMGSLGTIAGILTGVYLSYNLENIILFSEGQINALGSWYYLIADKGFWEPVQLIPKNVYYFDHLPVFIDIKFLHKLAITSLILSGVASLLPAYTASRLQPIEIIRGSDN